MEQQDQEMKLSGFLKEEKRFLKDLEKIDVDKNWSRFLTTVERDSTRAHTRTHRGSFRFVFSIAAAVLLLMATTLSIYFATIDSPHQVIRVSSGPGNLDIELNDGTTIMLNKESVISYPEKIKRREREVILSGEAWFEVESAKRSPFSVQIEKHTVKVLGTSFSIKGEQSGNIEVNVKEGVVYFFKKGVEEDAVSIIAGQKCIYHADTDEFKTENNSSDNYLFWKTGVLSYKDKPLSEVFRELESLFGQKIVVSDSLILKNRWNSTHTGEDLNAILDELCLYFDLTYIVKDDSIHIQRE